MPITKRASSLAVGILAAGLFACADQPNDVTAPRTTPQFAAQSTDGPSSLDLIEGDLDSGLLDKNNGNKYRSYAVLAPEKLPAKYRTNTIGKDATYSMVQLARDWDELSPSTKSEIMDLQANGFGELKNTVETAHFVLHFATQGNSAVPALDANGNGTPDFIDVAAQELGGHLGSPIEARLSRTKANTCTEILCVLQAARVLRVLHAHEFMHAVQFNINVYGSGWLMESHATWAEDAVYDANDWHWYINRFLSTPDFPIFNRYLYGAAFFQNWLSETRGVDVTRQIWLAHRTQSADNAIRNVAFGGSWDEGLRVHAVSPGSVRFHERWPVRNSDAAQFHSC